MNFLQIHNEQNYCDALERASQFFDDPPQMNSQVAEEFQALLSAIENYELRHYRIEPPFGESI
jgi:antitoxin component HigA of HigAB toxin-antitoxin module